MRAPAPDHRRHRTRRAAWGAGALVLALASLAIGALVGSHSGRDAATSRPGAPSARGAAHPSRTATAGRTATPAATAAIAWRHSRAIGATNHGRLVRGVELPAEGRDWFTWDAVRKRSPNRSWRRWGTDRLVRVLLRVLREYRAAHPGAPRVGIGDLSRPHGGDFGRRFGGLGHASHQNGLDVDVLYPRTDRLERRPFAPRQVDRRLAQALVDRFVAHGARYVFVGPRVGLTGPPRIVQRLALHDDHLHFRLRRG